MTRLVISALMINLSIICYFNVMCPKLFGRLLQNVLVPLISPDHSPSAGTVFSSHNNSAGTVFFSQFQPSFRPANEANKACFEGKCINDPGSIVCRACMLMSYWAGLFAKEEKKALEGVNTMLQIVVKLLNKKKPNTLLL